MKIVLRIIITFICAFVYTCAHAEYGKYNQIYWNPNQNGMGTPISHQRQH